MFNFLIKALAKSSGLVVDITIGDECGITKQYGSTVWSVGRISTAKRELDERLGYYLIANGITEEAKKKAVLLTSIGASNFTLLRSIAGPDGLDPKSYAVLVKLLQDHFDPKPSEIVERFPFNSQFRETGESVSLFITNLRSLLEHCNGESLEAMLRDQLVCGINDGLIQKRLLAEPKLTEN